MSLTASFSIPLEKMQNKGQIMSKKGYLLKPFNRMAYSKLLEWLDVFDNQLKLTIPTKLIDIETIG